MANKDLHHSVKAVCALAPQSITSDTTTVGEIIDTQGFDGVEFVIVAGALADSVLLPLVTECATSGGSYTAVADADLHGTEAGAQLDETLDKNTSKVGYSGTKRFVKLSLVSTSTTGANLVGAVALLGAARHAQAADAQIVAAP